MLLASLKEWSAQPIGLPLRLQALNKSEWLNGHLFVGMRGATCGSRVLLASFTRKLRHANPRNNNLQDNMLIQTRIRMLIGYEIGKHGAKIT